MCIRGFLFNMEKQIPITSPVFTGKEKRYLIDCIDRGWVTQGKYVEEFERIFRLFVGVKHAIAVSNGTVALHLALVAAGIDETLTIGRPVWFGAVSLRAVQQLTPPVAIATYDPEIAPTVSP